jgi:hypothetical protein
MKPLPVAPMTYEDALMWDSIFERAGELVWSSFKAYRESDRRDAALMLQWVQLRRMSFVGQSPVTWDGVPISGQVFR